VARLTPNQASPQQARSASNSNSLFMDRDYPENCEGWLGSRFSTIDRFTR
jgi:hypothetical protein